MKLIEENRNRILVALIAVGVLGGTCATVLIAGSANAASIANGLIATAATSNSVSAPLPFTDSAITTPDFTRIVDRFSPAVVNISVTASRSDDSDEADNASPPGAAPNMPGTDPNDPFFEFFRRFQGPNMPGHGNRHGQGAQQAPVRATGSGFIVSSDGLILTNAHVVRGAKEVMVKLTNRREFPAKVIGADDRTDVAVLRIDAANLPTVPLGKTKDLMAGEWVLAIGSPFGF